MVKRELRKKREMERKREWEGEGVFAELVPSFLTQLPRHGDLWWLGNDEITGAASPCPGFSANRKTFPPCSAFQSIQHISDGKSSIGIEIIFSSRKSCQIFIGISIPSLSKVLIYKYQKRWWEMFNSIKLQVKLELREEEFYQKVIKM